MSNRTKSIPTTPGTTPGASIDAGAGQTPDVDERFRAAQQALALLQMFTRARSTSSDLGLPEEVEAAGWCAIDNLLYDVLAHLRAIEGAIPKDVFGLDAPAA